MSGGADPVGVLRTHFRQAVPEPFTLEPVDAAEINSRNWIVALGGKPRFVLKRGPYHGIVEFYGEFSRKTPLLPPMAAFAREKDELFRLIEYREGRAAPGNATEAARALAQLHLALRDVPGALPFSERYLPLQKVPDLVSGKSMRAWNAEIEALEALPGLPRGWVHHDYHPGNALFQGAKVSAILDMDSIGTDFRMQAVAFGASRFGDAHRFLDAYHAVDPLTGAERRSYGAFVRREAVRRINWILRDESGAWRGELAKHLETIRKSHAA